MVGCWWGMVCDVPYPHLRGGERPFDGGYAYVERPSCLGARRAVVCGVVRGCGRAAWLGDRHRKKNDVACGDVVWWTKK